jgi:hypothetical protein
MPSPGGDLWAELEGNEYMRKLADGTQTEPRSSGYHPPDTLWDTIKSIIEFVVNLVICTVVVIAGLILFISIFGG